MKIYMKLSAAFLAVGLFASGCATFSVSAGGAEPINWREYNDC